MKTYGASLRVRIRSRFEDQEACIALLEREIHEDPPRCPQCGSTRTGRKNEQGGLGRLGRRNCYTCHSSFRATAGTVFSLSKIPLPTWFAAVLIVDAHPQISMYELARELEVNPKTALRMQRRICKAVADGDEGHARIVAALQRAIDE